MRHAHTTPFLPSWSSFVKVSPPIATALLLSCSTHQSRHRHSPSLLPLLASYPVEISTYLFPSLSLVARGHLRFELWKTRVGVGPTAQIDIEITRPPLPSPPTLSPFLLPLSPLLHPTLFQKVASSSSSSNEGKNWRTNERTKQPLFTFHPTPNFCSPLFLLQPTSLFLCLLLLLFHPLLPSLLHHPLATLGTRMGAEGE